MGMFKFLKNDFDFFSIWDWTWVSYILSKLYQPLNYIPNPNI